MLYNIVIYYRGRIIPLFAVTNKEDADHLLARLKSIWPSAEFDSHLISGLN